MHAYFQCLSPPFVSTLLIMYTHESITGHCGLSYRRTPPRLFNVFSAITFRDETRPTTPPRIHNTYAILCTLAYFAPVLIPTSTRCRTETYSFFAAHRNGTTTISNARVCNVYIPHTLCQPNSPLFLLSCMRLKKCWQ